MEQIGSIILLIATVVLVGNAQSTSPPPSYEVGSDTPFILKKTAVVLLLLVAIAPGSMAIKINEWISSQNSTGISIGNLSLKRFKYVVGILGFQAMMLTVESAYAVTAAFKNINPPDPFYYLLTLLPEILIMVPFLFIPNLIEEFDSPETAEVRD
ncbi:hypothetical protein HDU76_007635 [Blyttiomyces sp. JEL0837]|nr:hypothetical protein HDU76_007635 [Blyttiomyces sp. JEL0837]